MNSKDIKNVATATIVNLSWTNVSTTNLNSTNGTIATLNGTTATYTTVNGTNLVGTNLSGTNVSTTNLTVRTATAPTVNQVLVANDTAGNVRRANAMDVAMPNGADGDTVRHDGTNRIANNTIYNNWTNVGIGTTSPANKLSVNGNLGVAGGASIDGTTLYVDNTNHRVGVGTNSPEASLHISGGEFSAKKVVTETITTNTYIAGSVQLVTDTMPEYSECECSGACAVWSEIPFYQRNGCYYDFVEAVVYNYDVAYYVTWQEGWHWPIVYTLDPALSPNPVNVEWAGEPSPRCVGDVSYEDDHLNGEMYNWAPCKDILSRTFVSMRYQYKLVTWTNIGINTSTQTYNKNVLNTQNWAVWVGKIPSTWVVLDIAWDVKADRDIDTFSLTTRYIIINNKNIKAFNNSNTISNSNTTLPTESAVKGYVENRIENTNTCTAGFHIKLVENSTIAKILRINNSATVNYNIASVDANSINSLNWFSKAGECDGASTDDECEFSSNCVGNDRDFCAVAWAINTDNTWIPPSCYVAKHSDNNRYLYMKPYLQISKNNYCNVTCRNY